ncbi:MAG: penicillin-binding protein 2 [Candidatus Yanofskybacteria bacterium RIFCSPLOWO2_01_FULL_41_34]|uniref:Penicillin-binding protein 2 n=1 Tax=Candidatus Yanofskybacteria bacterium RIFCSPHIGHO2_01_FULL_41_26 TaxID=1802661 RepID=A0A1F8EEL9_9BACT|nr:MAG: penicillin-binding protein 2 [Candidatus Yanofskybacteria bacterium RIFCSPHIGHO2_01_FULL_41_26]OGN20928.1 MAG: penicillin-binding protein 2 [Candidatus Yanofskybacteria bacterium RIFCSPLOWO2_01_FULL_41_34]
MFKDYRVSVNEDWVSPEETLLDSGSEYSDIETPISADVFRFTFMVALILLAVAMTFTFKIGIADHDSYADLALQNKSVNFPIPPPRGVIMDRFGKQLVKNLPSFDLLVFSREVKANPSDVNRDKVAEVLKIKPEEFRIFISEGIRANSNFFAATNLNKDQVLAIKYLDPDGYYVVPNVKRYYVSGQEFSQIIGYIGKVNQDDFKDEYYYSTDMIGRLGAEAWYEEVLRGDHGRIFFSSNGKTIEDPQFGKDQKNDLNTDPVQGKNLVLNIDHDLQKKLYNELREILVSAGLSRGAAIIQNPQNGAVLAMVSFPSFDNNLFVKGLSDSQFKNLFESKTKPLFNRVIGGLYNPGSTIKPFIGMTALQEGIVTPQDTIKDCISLTVPNPFDKNSPYIFKNWRQDYGLFNLKKSIAQSCNIFFFTVGGGPPADGGNILGLGAEKIDKYLMAVMANSKLGIDIPGEESGFVPTPDWKLKTRGENWYQGDTYNISIGQGDLLVTPLWLNSYISAIANGGTIYKPMIAQKVVDENNNDMEIFKQQALAKLPFEDNIIQEMKSYMEETVISGTAGILKDLPVKAGAKTGTAEVVKGKSINSLFTAFAPFDNPELNITVLIEGSVSNQGLAIRAAHNVLKWYFGEYQQKP